MDAPRFPLSRIRKHIIAVLLAAGLLGVFLIAAAARNNRASVGAVILDVDTTADTNAPGFQVCSPAPNDCSLRGAISKANSNPADDYTIALDPATYTLSLAGIDEDDNATGDLDVKSSANVTITGVNSSMTVIQAGPFRETGIDRVFHMIGNGSLVLSELTVEHGNTKSYDTSKDRGGGVYLETGSLTVFSCMFNANVSGSGSGIYTRDTAIELDVNGCTFVLNVTGGAISNAAGRASITASEFGVNSSSCGGAVSSVSEINISDSNFYMNSAFAGSAYGGAICLSASTATILNSLFHDNEAETAGAIVNFGGDLFIYHSSFLYNRAGSSGAILSSASSADFPGYTLIAHSDFFGNQAEDAGAVGVGSIYEQPTDTYIPSTVAIVYSLFEYNEALSGWGGAVFSSGVVDIEGTTFIDNIGEAGGGAIAISHYTADTLLNVRNSTFAGNSANSGGAINGSEHGVITLTNVTMTDNEADGGGIATFQDIELHLVNTIIANSFGGVDCWDAGGNLVTSIANLVEDGTCSPAVTGDPMLDALQDNGGPTHTAALLPGSPAIDQGDDNLCEPYDQRGFLRILPCDIGAFEVDVVNFLYIFLPFVMNN